MPVDEFQARLDLARQQMTREGLDALVVYGDNYSFADLCYLTNYFPKVRGGIGVFPREGAVSLLLNIGSRDVPFAKTLTWVEDVRASNQLGRDAADLLKEKDLTHCRLGLLDSGKGFALPELEALKSALPGVEWMPRDSMFQNARLKKGDRELEVIRGAATVLGELCDEAATLIKSGRKEYEVIADIDRLARDKGVEDIRILAGEKRLLPPSSQNTAVIGGHWAVVFALQHDRYWAEAARTYILNKSSKLESVYRRAEDIVGTMANQLKPGGTVARVDKAARDQLGEFYAPAQMYGFGNGLGLDQWEAPFLSEEEQRQSGWQTPAPQIGDRMTVALRVVFETEGKLIAYGDTFEVKADGAQSLTNSSR
jgi:Xaa-Pro aminopeptidase